MIERRLKVITTVEALEGDLERRILDGEFAPGEHLREMELVASYNVGRHSIRGAFDGLARRGLVDKEPNRGVFVAVPTEADVRAIFELRALLEVEAFRRAAASKMVPESARAALTSLARLNSRSPWREVIQSDIDFHSGIVDALGNERISRIYRDIRSEDLLCRLHLVPRWGRTQRERIEQHRELLRALESGSPDRAGTAILAHLDWARRQILDRMRA